MKYINTKICLAMVLTILTLTTVTAIQAIEIPAVHSGIETNSFGEFIYVTPDGDTLGEAPENPGYTLDQLRNSPTGYEKGIYFDFNNIELNGSLHYGLIDIEEGHLVYQPVFFKRTAPIEKGRAQINIIKNLKGKYDIINWQETGRIRLGYRVIDDRGVILYDGKIMLRGTGPFTVDTSIIEGPFVNQIGPEEAVITFITNYHTEANIEIGGNSYSMPAGSTQHEIRIDRLKPDTTYDYYVNFGDNTEGYLLQTAPEPGARNSFTFAYASDSRAGRGGGERGMKGCNAYILKRIGAFCLSRDVRFLQFTGDMIDGYTNSRGEIDLEYANWKMALGPYWRYFPIIPGMGNHEAYNRMFTDNERWVAVDNFPYDKNSTESVFAEHFANPINGPKSEDGSVYDPDPDRRDFPSYTENVFYYNYDNIGIIVLNSNYWYSFSVDDHPASGGNLHGYLMDKQLEWLAEVLDYYENEETIDHVFVTHHTPVFPNGGHVDDDMWYNGDNSYRATVNGQPLDKGIIERRDEYLDLLMNRSSKVVAVLTGDEHNYSLLRIDENLPIYPFDWDKPKLENFRTIWQINNGAAGAPYYGKEDTPWKEHIEAFSTRNALVLFHVDGQEIEVEVVNPETLEEIDRFQLR